MCVRGYINEAEGLMCVSLFSFSSASGNSKLNCEEGYFIVNRGRLLSTVHTSLKSLVYVSLFSVGSL